MLFANSMSSGLRFGLKTCGSGLHVPVKTFCDIAVGVNPISPRKSKTPMSFIAPLLSNYILETEVYCSDRTRGRLNLKPRRARWRGRPASKSRANSHGSCRAPNTADLGVVEISRRFLPALAQVPVSAFQPNRDTLRKRPGPVSPTQLSPAPVTI